MSQKLDTTLTCPTCGAPNNGLTHLSGKNPKPKDGDITLCTTCSTVLTFVNNVTAVRPLTEQELLNLPLKTLAQLALARAFIKANPPPSRTTH